jgi:peptidyl-prolyl cis-trans isomerase B (cyclophilin B)
MGLRLSQSLARSDQDRRGSPAGCIRPVVGMLIFLAMALACDHTGMGTDPALGTQSLSATEASERSATFEWPDDPSHPILTLEIDSGATSGTIAIELMPELAPATVAHVSDLAKQGYYDETTFHRVIPGFMIQGGDPKSRDRDPSNDGHGNPELRLADEFSSASFLRGVVGMGNKGRPNSTGGQFFIMQADNQSLDGRYTVIGRVVSGMDVVDTISEVPIDRLGRWGPKHRPIENVLMTRVAVEQKPSAESVQTATHKGDASAAMDADI